MNSQSRKYLNTISATIIALIKTPAGLVMGYCLYQLFSPFVRHAKSFRELAEMLTIAFRNYFSTVAIIPDSVVKNEITKQIVISTSITVVMIIAFVSLILMVLLETIALWMLRIAGKGAGIVRVIHWIYCIIAVVYLVLSLVQLGTIIAVGRLSNEGLVGIIIVMVFVTIFYMIFICYHKDIAMAMKTVGIESRTGRVDPGFKKTHLSGLSILLGIPSLLLGILGCLVYVQVVSTVYDLNGRQYVISEWMAAAAIAVLFISFIKQAAISKSYGNLKKARY